MKQLVFDIETNGLLDTLDRVHCLCIGDLETREVKKFSVLTELHEPIENGIKLLQEADQIIGFNNLVFDTPALEKTFKTFDLTMRKDWTSQLDLLVFARLKFPDVTGRDFELLNGSNFPRNLIGKHSLEAWGYRLGVNKGDFGKTNDWSCCTPEMVDYCAQDIQVTMALYDYLRPMDYSSEAIQLEHDIKRYIDWQEAAGVPFDTVKARELYKTLKEQYDSKWGAVKDMFPPKVTVTTWVPKVNSTKFGYKKGVPTTKRVEEEFNPGSRQQLVDYFKTKYNWVPVDFTEKGSPEIGYDVLAAMPYAEAGALAELFDIKKLMGMLFDGNNGWLKTCKNGRIHGGVITNGAISGRMTHFAPNIAQVPNSKAFMGKECRDLFWAGSDDMEFVDADASALELRLFAHFLHLWDEGEYANIVLNGDIHTENMKAFGLTDRNKAKTLIFAMLYGCGAAKAGSIVDATLNETAAKEAGRELINNFKKARPAYSHLINAVYAALDSRGHLIGLDGRKLVPRSKHAGLNTLIQGAGAVLMKKATLIFEPKLIALKGNPTLHIHDAISCIVPKGNGEAAGKAIVESIKEAGEFYKIKVPMSGAYGVGRTWGGAHG